MTNMNLLIYGGYHQDYIYTNHLTEGISKNKNINTFPTFYKKEKNKFLRKKNHYFPPHFQIRNYVEEIILKNDITHILNYNTNHFSSNTIEYFKKKYNLKFCVYFNDSPFSYNLSKKIYYQNQKKILNNYDYIFVYRNEDRDKIIKKYCYDEKSVKLLLPSCPEKKYLKHIKVSNKFLYDFAFIGHYEADGRIEVIRKLINKGYSCLVIGHKWPEKKIDFFNTNSKILNKRLEYTEYLALISSAYVNLGFVSKINNDIYTRRYFECPFSNSLFLAYESDIYNDLNNCMPNIYYSKNRIPTVNECINALKISLRERHAPTQEQKEIFYKKNSIYERACTICDLLHNY